MIYSPPDCRLPRNTKADRMTRRPWFPRIEPHDRHCSTKPIFMTSLVGNMGLWGGPIVALPLSQRGLFRLPAHRSLLLRVRPISTRASPSDDSHSDAFKSARPGCDPAPNPPLCARATGITARSTNSACIPMYVISASRTDRCRSTVSAIYPGLTHRTSANTGTCHILQ